MTNWRKIIFSLFFLVSLALVLPALAQEVDDQALFGGEAQKTGLATTLGLSDADPRIVAANLIRIFLGFLGLITVGLILYAGWLYMKSQGKAEDIEKAKDILKSATIGLLIILSAFAIVTFILSSILDATGGNEFTGDNTLPGGGWFDGSAGFYLASSEPTADEMNVFRDQPITLSFNLQASREIATAAFFTVDKVAEFQLSTFETGISTNTVSTAANNGSISIIVSTSSDLTTVTLKAASACEVFNGVSTTTRQNCLPAWSKFHVTVKDTVVSLNGTAINCDAVNHPCEFDFYTNDSFGEGRPVIRNITPVGGFCRQGTSTNATSTNEACLSDRDCQHWLSSTTATNPDWRCDTITPNAKAGNFVSISGRNFGTAEGLIEFSNATDWIIAPTSKSINAACAGWTDTEIVAVMPAGINLNSTSSIRLKTADNQVEYNNDKFGPIIKDVLVNDIERPGLCQVTPNQGLFSSSTTYYGQKLLQTRAYMGGVNSLARATSSDLCTSSNISCAGSVPNIGVGTTSTFVMRGLAYSNFLSFHKNLESYKGPMITDLAPLTGPKGQYVTIKGSGFGYAPKEQLGFGHGSSSHVALFVKKNSLAGLGAALSDYANSVCRHNSTACNKDFIEASFDFPPICSEDLWKNNQVIVKVPAGIDDGTDGTVGDYYLFLAYPKNGEVGAWLVGSDQINENNARVDNASGARQEYFTADKNALLLPGLCAIRPTAGLPGVSTDIYGEHFPVNAGDKNVYFPANVLATPSAWLGFNQAQKADHATTSVPVGAITGGVAIKLGNGSSSNPIDFKVGACKNSSECGSGIFCCPSGSAFEGDCKRGTSELAACYSSLQASVFAWSFSTYMATSSESCSGFANANACMLGNTCPNSPGLCQSDEGKKDVGTQCTDDYCEATYKDYCKNGNCVYDSNSNYCASSTAGTVATIATCDVLNNDYVLPGTANKKVEAFCNEVGTGLSNNGVETTAYYWQYQPKFGASCEGNSVMGLGGWCTIRNASGVAQTCSTCSSGFKCQAGKCVIGDPICPGNTKCDNNGAEATCRENFTCECCCKVGNDAQDCCSGLTCTPNLCVNDAKDVVTDKALYGQCTGCTKYDTNGAVDQDASNLACSCNSDNRFCNTEAEVYINGEWRPNPTGICQDRAKIDEPCSATSIPDAITTTAATGVVANKPQVAYWKLDSDTNSRNLYDSVRLANTALGLATISNGLSNLNQWQASGCMSDKCLRFSSSNSNYARLGLVTTQVRGDQTWSFWVKPTATSSKSAILATNFLGVNYDANQNIELEVCLDKTPAGLCGANRLSLSSGPYPLNEWIHVAVVVENGKKIEIIANNVSTSTSFIGQHIATSTAINNVMLGSSTIGNLPPVSGLVDEIQFYGQALDASTIASQTNGFKVLLPSTFNSTTTTITTSKINQAIAAGTASSYWQSEAQITGQSYLDYNGKYTIGTRPATCTTANQTSQDILPGATTTCRLVTGLTDGTANAGYWQVKKPQGAPCPPKTVLAPASTTSEYGAYPWCTVAGKVNVCSSINATSSAINGASLGGEATCNLFSYGASNDNQAGYCAANLPICQNGLQCDPNSCTCQVLATSTETSVVRAGEPCTKNGAGACTVGAPSCESALTGLACIPDAGNADCRCCCNPGDGKGIAKSAAYPLGADWRTVYDSKGNSSTLTCLPDKGACSGGARGLFCGCVDDNQCNNGSDGCGLDTCCSSRPFAVGAYPYNFAGEVGATADVNRQPVCRNTQISMTFNGPMNPNSFTGNIIVAGDYDDDLCPDDTTYLTTIVSPSNFAWLKRILTKVIAFFVGHDSAFAQASKTYCAIAGRVSADEGNKKIVFSPLKMLEPNRTYHVVVVGDGNATDALREGVLNMNEVGIHDDNGTNTGRTMGGPNSFAYASSSIAINGRIISGYAWHFKTKPETANNQGICRLDKVAVTTQATSTSWVFQSSINNTLDDAFDVNFDQIATDSDKDFVAQALTQDNQPIVPIDTVYSWDWNWTSQNTTIVDLRNHPNNLTDHSVVYVARNNKDAQTTVTAEAKITADTVNSPSTNGKSYSGKATVRVFMCNNPWPPLNDPALWPWQDSSNCTVGDASAECTNNNFEFYYCRDAGGPGTADDLPVISTDPVSFKKGQGFCETGYSYNKACSDNDGCLKPDKGDLKCINKVCSGGKKADDSAWGNAGGKCSSDRDCQVGGNCKIILKEFFFGRDSVPVSDNFNLQADVLPLGSSTRLSWTQVAGASGYKIYYGQKSGQYTDNIEVSSINDDYVFNNLDNSKRYYFAITSFNANRSESSYSAEVVVDISDTTAPTAPTAISAVSVSDIVKVDWTHDGAEVAKFRVYYGSSHGIYGDYLEFGPDIRKADLKNLNVGTMYFIAVTALDKNGNESPRSARETFIIAGYENLLYNMDFESGAIDGMPAGWAKDLNNPPKSTVGVSTDKAVSGTKSLKLTQAANYNYPEKCSQDSCENRRNNSYEPDCTWDAANNTCTFAVASACAAGADKVYSAGEWYCWPHMMRNYVSFGANLSNVNWQVGKDYILAFYYRGTLKRAPDISLGYWYNWLGQCSNRDAYHAPGGVCRADMTLSECSDEPGKCCRWAKTSTGVTYSFPQRKCYPSINVTQITPIPVGTYETGINNGWNLYIAKFTYNANMLDLIDANTGALRHYLGLIIEQVNTMSGGTEFYIDDIMLAERKQ